MDKTKIALRIEIDNANIKVSQWEKEVLTEARKWALLRVGIPMDIPWPLVHAADDLVKADELRDKLEAQWEEEYSKNDR